MIALTMTNMAITVCYPRVASLRPKRYVVIAAIVGKENGDVRDHVPYPRMWRNLKHVLIPTIVNMFPSVNDVIGK
jgi:hypothetical protein